MRFTSHGVLRYERFSSAGPKLIVEVDPELVRYARSLIPKAWECHQQKYAPHISVVRNEEPSWTTWGKYEGFRVEFSYEPEVYFDEQYYWLRVYSERLAEIRVELGLPPSRRGVTLSPNGDARFHVTIGNRKS